MFFSFLNLGWCLRELSIKKPPGPQVNLQSGVFLESRLSEIPAGGPRAGSCRPQNTGGLAQYDPCRACLLFFLQEHTVGGTWTIHWVPGPSLPLPVRLPGGQVQLALLQLCHSTSISNRVFIKSYRADVFTIRCCSFLFLNLFRAEEEECDLLTCWEPWHLVKNRYSLDFC